MIQAIADKLAEVKSRYGAIPIVVATRTSADTLDGERRLVGVERYDADREVRLRSEAGEVWQGTMDAGELAAALRALLPACEKYAMVESTEVEMVARGMKFGRLDNPVRGLYVHEGKVVYLIVQPVAGMGK